MSVPKSHTQTSFSWLALMLSIAMGLLGALLPDISCSGRTCGEWRGWGADAEPPVVPMLAGGEGGTSPETAWMAYEGKGRGRHARRKTDLSQDCQIVKKKGGVNAEESHLEWYLFGGMSGGQVFFHLLFHGLSDVVVCRILEVCLYLC